MPLNHPRFAAALLLTCSLATLAAPPAAPVQDVVDVMHGVPVRDPYRAFEDVKSPQTLAWLRAQGAYASEQLAAIPGRDALQARIAALSSASGDTVRGFARLPGGRLFYLKRKAGASQFNLVVRDGLSGAEKVLVDAVALSKDKGVPHAINYYVPSWDGQRVAYGISAGGSEDASLYVLDLRSGRQLIEPIPDVLDASLVNWTPDSQSLAYNRLKEKLPGQPETETYMDSTVYLLKVTAPGAKPVPLFGPLVNPELKLDRLDVASVQFDPTTRYMLARTTDTTVPEGKLFVAPLSALKDGGPIAWARLSGFDDKITAVDMRRDTLYLRSYAGAPRGRVLALDLATPLLSRAREVVPEPARGVLMGFSLGRDALYAQVREGFSVHLLRYADAGGPGVDVAPTLKGSAFAIADPGHVHSDVYYATSAWTEPSRILRSARPGVASDTGLRDTRKPAGAPEVEVTEVLVPSHDGAMVPLAILHKKGLVLDGKNPTLLIGYGAYGISFEARYDTTGLAWIERGGVVALANVRGTSAFGDAWHRAGFKTTKPNTWKDGIACARYLIAKGYASPKTMGIWGTSAGGIFVGRAVTEAPELFAAAVFDVGMLDSVRSELSANGVTNISEFGTVKDPQEFRALLEMSTYHQIKDGTPYPAVLLVHGLNDPRVDVWNSAKAAARLQAASSSGKPILLRLDEQAGHGIGSSAQQTYSERADIYSFLLSQFGMATAAP